MARIKYRESLGIEVRRGRPSIGSMPSKEDLARLYIGEGKSIREVAKEFACSKDMTIRALKAYGIEARINAKRSRLRKYSLKDLKSVAGKKGVRGAARDLGVNPSTLSLFLRSKVAD